MATKSTVARFSDYIYDPLFVVSGPKDYYKAAVAAKISSAKFAICPIFPSMFSDLPHQPRQQYIMRKTAPIPQYQPPSSSPTDMAGVRPVDVQGVDRHKFFFSPVPKAETDHRVTIATPPPTPVGKIIKHNKKIQTQYRESSAQTVPWQPANYLVLDDEDPELLMLDYLKWGSGLPAGMHEVRLIERARLKRTWEKALPPVSDAASVEKRRALIEAMARDEWAFREQEIQDIHDLRLELLVRMLNELHQKSQSRTEKRMKMFAELKVAEKEAKLKSLRHKADRELRKLDMKHRGLTTKYRKVDIVEEHVDRKSELYAPLMRHGEHPKRWHMVIDDHVKKYRAQFLGVEDISTLPRWLDQATKAKDFTNLNLPGTRLCIRETKWTSPVLKELHEELKNLRQEHKRPCTLMERVATEPSEIVTPQVEVGDDWEEELHQASILIESVLRGRASQILIFEGRDRCRELIEELRSTHALQEDDKINKFNQRLEVKSQQRQHIMCVKNTEKLKETLDKLSGTVVGTLLDFLNKELRRLLDERRAHAMCILFERERNAREAGEAGRRQTELRRRLEHDEMFKQVVKVHQDTVDLYLQDIITEGMDFASTDEAGKYVESLAAKIDDEAHETNNKLEHHEKEEIIAGLVHNFLLPEIEKQIVRDKIKQKQHNYLKTAHAAIYKKVEDLHPPHPKVPRPDPSSGKKLVGKSRHMGPVGMLEPAVKIMGFADLNLPETQTPPSEGPSDDLSVIYAAPGKFFMDRQSEASSIMGSLQFRRDKSNQDITQLLKKESPVVVPDEVPATSEVPNQQLELLLEDPSGEKKDTEAIETSQKESEEK